MNAARITKVGSLLSGHRFDAGAIVFDFAEKQFTIHRRPMTVSVQLNIAARGCYLLNFGYG